ncbi:hypothetical protein IV203_035440 [Nitzschia inconspicua]|uniref:Uncharacterized protein n=1 Tax=Nitzschia inconspicua TaxID=303405 RepID=A0A9K3PUZ2_9STRA|nr:hypothetical protein IV203_035440 [Nitzschia inconspicua]
MIIVWRKYGRGDGTILRLLLLPAFLVLLEFDVSVVLPTVPFATRNAFLTLSDAFSPQQFPRRNHYGSHSRTTVIHSNRNDNSNGRSGTSSGGYRFGDFTRGAINRFQGRVNSLTGKSKYEFGDLSRWLDSKAKESAEKFTSRPNYQFGDITKEVIRRLVNGEYDRDDLLLLLKIVATVGISMQPVARVLPMKVLMDLLNLSLEASIAQTVGEKVITSLTNEVDARMKEMITGNREYQFGDYTKRIVNTWTGKETYEFGDMTKTILGRLQEREAGDNRIKAFQTDDATGSTHEDNYIAKDIVLELNETDEDALKAWDKEFFKYQREKEGLAPLQDDDLYRDWDERYLSSLVEGKR